VSYLHHDQSGSTRLLTSSVGEVVGKCSYGAYGSPDCEGSEKTPLGYDGQYTNADTGLVYLRAREYDPATGQFMSSDPLKAITEEPYSYARDNPLTYWDPSGLIFGIPGTPSTGEVINGIGEAAETGLHVVEHHYGQIAEFAALGACVATAVGAPLCLVATGAAFTLSTIQNVENPCGFSPAAELLDGIGTLPGLQVAGAEAAGLAGAGIPTATKVFTTITGGAGIIGASPIAQAEAATRRNR
jgi:RHS repeat-associated protein